MQNVILFITVTHICMNANKYVCYICTIDTFSAFGTEFLSIEKKMFE